MLAASVLCMGLPDGCNSTGNVGVEPGYYDEALSPSPEAGTFADPMIVTRDNPGLKGTFWAKGSSNAKAQGRCKGKKCTYRHALRGKWENVAAWVGLSEYQDDQTLVTSYKGPFLPIHKQQAPAFMKWASRTFDLVHGNVYGATVQGAHG